MRSIRLLIFDFDRDENESFLTNSPGDRVSHRSFTADFGSVNMMAVRPALMVAIDQELEDEYGSFQGLLVFFSPFSPFSLLCQNFHQVTNIYLVSSCEAGKMIIPARHSSLLSPTDLRPSLLLLQEEVALITITPGLRILGLPNLRLLGLPGLPGLQIPGAVGTRAGAVPGVVRALQALPLTGGVPEATRGRTRALIQHTLLAGVLPNLRRRMNPAKVGASGSAGDLDGTRRRIDVITGTQDREVDTEGNGIARLEDGVWPILYGFRDFAAFGMEFCVLH